MRRAVLWIALGRRGALACAAVGLAGALVTSLVCHETRIQRAPIGARPPVSASPSIVRDARPSSSGGTATVPVHVRVEDGRGRPVSGASVEVWADGRGCVDRAPSNERGMRGDVVDAPAGQVVWRSASGTTASDGTLELRVPVGMMTHVIAFDRAGDRALFRAPDDDCFAPCAGYGGCGTCSHAPCTWPRQDGRCASEVVDVVLRLAAPATIVGRVTDTDGRPITGARVATMHVDPDDDLWPDDFMLGPPARPVDEWSRVAPSPPHRNPILTGSDGRFAFDVVESQPFVVAAVAPGHHARVSRRLRIAPGGSARVDLRLRRAAHLDLHVVDRAGEPVGGARVAFGRGLDWDGQDARTDAAGHLLLDSLDDGEQELIVYAEGYEELHRWVAPRSRPLTIELPAIPHVRVEVSVPAALIAAFGDRPILDLYLLRPDETLVAGKVKRPASPPDMWRFNPYTTRVEKQQREKAEVDATIAALIAARDREGSVEIEPDGRGRVAIGVAAGVYRVCVTEPGPGSCGPTVRIDAAHSPAITLRLAADGSIASWD